MIPIGFVSDHMEVIYDLDTEARATAEELGLPFARAATAGVDPRFVAMVRDLLLERAATERDESPERASVGSEADLGRVPGAAAAPTRGGPRRRCAARTEPVTAPDTDTDLLAPGPRDRSRGRAARRRDARARGRRRRHEVQPDRRGHRGRPACEDLIRERLLGRRPDDGFLGEEGDDIVGTSGVRWIVDPIDGTVNYLYGLPHYAVSIAAARGDEVVAGVVLSPRRRAGVRRDAGGGATCNGVPAARPPPPRRSTRPWSPPDSATRPRCATRQAQAWPGCSRRCATSVARGPAPSTCARSPRASSTPTSRRGRTPGTTPPAGWSPRSPARSWRSGPRSSATTWWCALPTAGWSDFSGLVRALRLRGGQVH